MIMVSVRCDFCGVVAGTARRNRRNAMLLLRSELRKTGWAHEPRRAVDHCPACVKKLAEGRQPAIGKEGS